MTGLIFATNQATGAAVVEAIDQDQDVRDGVVPYDPPEAPPTAPDNAGTTFALVSCQYPAGFLDAPVAYQSYGRLLDRLVTGGAARPRFVVLTGDQVYVDPTAGLYDPSAADDRYQRPYELWLRHPEVRGALRRVPSFMLLDDHEIDDNWEPLPAATPDEKDNAAKRKTGLESYGRYQRGMAPKPTAFQFKYDGFPFFMLDTRSERTLRTVGNLATAKLFSDATLAELETWLTAAPAGPKFIVSPSMLLPRHRRAVQHAPTGGGLDSGNLSAIHSDGWDGYPNTLRAVLGFIAANGIQNVVFLSGDEHRGCVAEIKLRDATGTTLLARAHSIHTTAAYAPFPFANSLAEDFVKKETITFSHGGTTYKCDVDAKLPTTRDGATLLHPRQDGAGAWLLDYEYTDGGVQTLTL